MYNINNYSSIILILANTYNNSTTNTIITNNKIISSYPGLLFTFSLLRNLWKCCCCCENHVYVLNNVFGFPLIYIRKYNTIYHHQLIIILYS